MSTPLYIVMTAAACMPSTCKFGSYRKVAVVLTDGVRMPTQIHPRHNAVRQIVRVWDRVNVGTTARCAYRQALAAAQQLAAQLNAQQITVAA